MSKAKPTEPLAVINEPAPAAATVAAADPEVPAATVETLDDFLRRIESAGFELEGQAAVPPAAAAVQPPLTRQADGEALEAELPGRAQGELPVAAEGDGHVDVTAVDPE